MRALLVFLLAILTLGCSSEDRRIVSIGTGGTGGVYYPFGGGLAEIWSKYVPGVRAIAEVTGASVENVRLADRGETVIGEIMGDVAYQAYHGEGVFAGDPQNILALAVMYPNVLHVVTLRGSGVQDLSGLAGHTVSIGAPGSGTAFMSKLVLEALGIPEDRLSVRRLSFVENANALRDRVIDAGIWCVAPPTSSIMDLATTHAIRVLGFSPEEVARVIERYPFYASYELPAGTYRNQDQPVTTLSVWNVIICWADLPDDLVYDLTRVLFEHTEYLERIHPFARFTRPDNTAEHAPIPLHPGAARYLREQGISLPPELEIHE